MRLIDADALAKELMHEGLGYQYNRVINAPTVEAVPVEFIKETISAYTVDLQSCDDLTAWKRIVKASALQALLNAWAERKEE